MKRLVAILVLAEVLATSAQLDKIAITHDITDIRQITSIVGPPVFEKIFLPVPETLTVKTTTPNAKTPAKTASLEFSSSSSSTSFDLDESLVAMPVESTIIFTAITKTTVRPATAVDKGMVAPPVESTIVWVPFSPIVPQPDVVGNPVFSTLILPSPTPAAAVPSIENAATDVNEPASKLPTGAGVTVPILPTIVSDAPVLRNDTATITANDSFDSLNASFEVKIVAGFCGYPPYSERQKCISQNYFTDLLSQCEVAGGAIVFSCVIGLLGICIILVNALLPIVVWRNPEMRTQYDYIKVSLAFADMTTGVLLLASVLPNVSLLRNLTLEKAAQYVKDDTNSPTAIIVGSLLTVTAQASILHLMFLSIERFSAIKWLFWHIKRKTSSVVLTLAAIWIVSFVSSFIPAAFPKYFEYKLQPALLIYVMTIKSVADANGTQHLGYHGPLYASIALLLPYAVTVVFCILTSVVVYQKFTSGVRKFNKQHGDDGSSGRHTANASGNGYSSTPTKNKNAVSKVRLKPEIAVFVTIVIMIAAFTITLLPFVIVMFLFVGGVLQCFNYTIPYVVAFYIGMLNRLMNALIYTVRDRNFRAALRKVFNLEKIASMTSPAGHSGSNSTQL